MVDGYNTVIRFTDFVTKGYEGDVGSKTTHWITGGAKQTKQVRRSLPNSVKKIYLSPLQYTIPTMSQFIKHYLKMTPTNFVFYHDISTAKYLMSCLQIYPSTGLFMILLLIAKFGKVSTLGFNFFQDGGIHYYDSTPVKNGEHNWKREYEIYHDLKKMGFINDLLDG